MPPACGTLCKKCLVRVLQCQPLGKCSLCPLFNATVHTGGAWFVPNSSWSGEGCLARGYRCHGLKSWALDVAECCQPARVLA